MTVGIGNMLTTGIKATNFSLPTCPLREEKSFSQRFFSIYTDIRKLGASTFSSYNKAKGRRGFDMSNSLAAVHPELIAEWSEKNLPLTPDSITFGSNKKVWWKGACGHEWTAVLSSAALISFLYPAID